MASRRRPQATRNRAEPERSMVLPHLAAALTLLSLPTLAAARTGCPAAAEPDRGIRVTFADGGTEDCRTRLPGLVSVPGARSGRPGPSPGPRPRQPTPAAGALHDGILDPTRGIGCDDGLAPADLPEPLPGGGWSTPGTVNASPGIGQEPQVQATDAPSPIAVGPVPRRSVRGSAR
jgi:hypothetical protein